MPMVSLNNHNQNSPWWWKRIESAMMVALIPAFTGFITAVPLDEHTKVLVLAGSGFFVGFLKFIGIILGDSAEQPTNPNKPQT